MATQIQLRRGSTTQHATFTGAVGEVTVDTDKDVVVVHDGSLAGGYPMAGTSIAQTFSKAQRGAITALTDGATITPDFSAANNFSVTLGGNRTLANPTNITAGQSGIIVITQDGTGSRTLAFGSNWKFPNGTAPTLTTTASKVDVLAYYCESASRISAQLLTNLGG
jgi:hypothetical protein